jgi:hypothetical protein
MHLARTLLLAILTLIPTGVAPGSGQGAGLRSHQPQKVRHLPHPRLSPDKASNASFVHHRLSIVDEERSEEDFEKALTVGYRDALPSSPRPDFRRCTSDTGHVLRSSAKLLGSTILRC